MLDKIIGLVEQKKNLFITGGGGVGKSYILGKLKEKFPYLDLTATTGIAAVNIGGQTIHSWSGARLFTYPLTKTINIVRHIPEIYFNILDCQMLAIDEISMLASYQLDYLDALFRSIRRIDKPFGGIQMLLFGDLFQLPPVKRGNYVKIADDEYLIDYCFKAKCWNQAKFETIELTKVYRQNDVEFVNILNSIRKGKPTNLELLNKCTNLIIPENATRLFAKNERVKYWNRIKYSSIPSDEMVYHSRDYWVNEYGGLELGSLIETIKSGSGVIKDLWDPALNLTKTQQKIRDDFNKYCKATREIRLKVGAKVMLLYNIDVPKGLCNGACGYVKALDQGSVTVEFENGITQEIHKCIFTHQKRNKIIILRKQIPLMLAYAITVHKSQGLSINNLAIDFDGIFECGQAYVALSRATNLSTLYLQNFSTDAIKVDNEIVQFYDSIKQSDNDSKLIKV